MEATPPIGAAYLAADIGSTFTKLVAVESGSGRLLARATHRTTTGTGDVLRGHDAAAEEVRAALARVGGADPAARELVAYELACSSAGGGLRLAVVGQERLISVEAGRRVALSAGARVVAVTAGMLTAATLAELTAAAPDVLLLVGGVDGGDETVLRHNARSLAEYRGAEYRRAEQRLTEQRLVEQRLVDDPLTATPVVVAGNAAARAEVAAELRAAGWTVLTSGNVLPDIGEFDPDPARAAIRAVFLDHVIGGLSPSPRLAATVRMVTPDAVLAAVAALAGAGDGGDGGDAAAGAVMVVDVGGATTDVYSALPGAVQPRAPSSHAVGEWPRRRTVEGDLGVRWSAPGILEALRRGRGGARVPLVPPEVDLATAARLRAAEPGLVPAGADDTRVDLGLATAAVVLAIRRHHDQVDGYGARGVTRLVLSGGVFRHAGVGGLAAVARVLRDDALVGAVLGPAPVEVDQHYVLAAAGLIAESDPETADRLLRRYLRGGAP